jgi:hypothetical protein
VQLISQHELIYVTASLTYRGAMVALPNVLVDTGAASTVINADLAADAGIFLVPDDQLRRLRGVGGHEHVFVRHVGSHGIDGFEIEIGEMDYGFEFSGIIGMDYLRAARAIIDLGNLTIDLADRLEERGGVRRA